MDTPTGEHTRSRVTVSVLWQAVQNGVNQYRSLRESPATVRLLGTAATTYIGNRFNTIALIALSFELGESALGVGGMFVSLSLPRLILQAPAGALVDRFPGKRLLMTTQLMMAVIAGSFALLAIVPSLWLLYALTLVMGIVRTVDFPAFEVRLISLTPPERRGTANAVHMLAMTAGEVVGPLLGGVVLMLVGATPLFLIHAVTFLVVVFVLAGLPEQETTHSSATNVDVDEEPDSPGALSYISLLRRSNVSLYIAVRSTSCILFCAVLPLYIVKAHEMGLGERGVGLFYATMGVGTLVGSTVAGVGSYMSRRALGISAVASLTGAGFLTGFGLAESLVLALPALLLFGAVGDVEEIAALTYFQNTLPEGVYGRFFALFMMCTGIGGIVGPIIGPLLTEAFGMGPALALLGIPVIALAAILGIREGDLRFTGPHFTAHPIADVRDRTQSPS